MDGEIPMGEDKDYLPLVQGHCSNPDCTNADVGFEIDDENRFCPKCGFPLEAD